MILHRHLNRTNRFVLIGASACVGMATLAACSSAPAEAARTNVVLVGDSLAEQAAQYLPAMIGSKTFTPDFFGGSAPCDWVDKDLKITDTSVVVISFTGNAISPCMADGAGGQLAGTAVVDKYRTDVVALVDRARSAKADVVLVGQPVHGDAAGGNDIVDGLNAMYKKMAARSHVSYVDAGAAVENSDGTFAQTLPCAPNDQACDPSGANVIRSDDGLHFCPGSPPPGPCPTYASGAFRFAAAIAAELDKS